jgi:hypothetical protein
MPLYTLAGIAVGIAFASVGLYHVVFVGPQIRSISRTLRGDGHPVEGESVASLRFALEAFERRTTARLDALETVVKRDLLKIGFLRFNAFSDVGSDLSFALALLNAQGDGVVVTSIYSREDTRTYGKAVNRFVPAQGASSEEQLAISMSRQAVTSVGTS